MYKKIDSCSYKVNACFLLKLCNTDYANSKYRLFRVCCISDKDIILLKSFDDLASSYRFFLKCCKKHLFPNAFFKWFCIFLKDLF